MKKSYIIMLCALFVPMLALSVWSLIDRDSVTSESENRALAERPAFSLASWISGELPADFEAYYSDTFPLRETLLSANKTLNKFYYFSPFADSEGDGVTLIVEGPGGDQLAHGGEALPTDDGDVETAPPMSEPPESEPPTTETEPPVETPTETPTTPTPEPPALDDNQADLNAGIVLISGGKAVEVTTANHAVMSLYAGAINNYAAAMPDTRVINIVVPNSAAFNAPEDYRTGERDQKMIIDEVYSQLDEGIVSVDAYSTLRMHTDEYIYFRTDHHWTQLGAYYAYTALCDTIGLDAVPLDGFEQGSIDGFLGSLYTYTSKYPQSSVLKNNPDTVYWYRPQRDFKSTIYKSLAMDPGTSQAGYVVSSKVNAANKYLAFISGDNPLMVINTDVANSKSVLVVKESYGNAFVPFLVNHYETVYVVDPRKYNGSDKPNGDLAAFVNEKQIDDLIVFDYPLVVSNNAFVNILNRMVGK